MKLKIATALLVLFSLVVFQGRCQHGGFDKSTFYRVLESGTMDEMDAQIGLVKASSLAEKEAYEGTLLMKKAALVAKPKSKLDLFKAGRLKLEASISKNGDNVEYRFLRLIIQENAPKILKYRNELEEDAGLIQKNFRGLQPFLQQQIADYSKKSKVLKIP